MNQILNREQELFEKQLGFTLDLDLNPLHPAQYGQIVKAHNASNKRVALAVLRSVKKGLPKEREQGSIYNWTMKEIAEFNFALSAVKKIINSERNNWI